MICFLFWSGPIFEGFQAPFQHPCKFVSRMIRPTNQINVNNICYSWISYQKFFFLTGDFILKAIFYTFGYYGLEFAPY